ncbi:MAG: alpha-glucosidase C-terminal domain-containing protein [Opitutales bacterium]|nr:alpha-glucosidase C-terminal domain-containing protein [Opitutales bacterium]
MKKYITLPILLLLSVGSLFSQEGKPDNTWRKRLPAIQAELKVDCSNSEARKISDDLKQAVIYQLFMRMFTPEGTIKAAEKRLPHLKELGVDIIYTCPLVLSDDDTNKAFWSRRQKTGTNPKNPYRIKDYFEIDPEYGTEDDLKSFVATAHKLGMRVIFDLVYYHCGPKANLLNMDKDFVRRDENGNVINGRWNFPELNFDNKKLREYLWSNMEYFVKEFDIDGYRIDVEYYVPLSFWEEGAKRIRKLKPDAIMLAESTRPSCQLKAYDINYGWRSLESSKKIYTKNESVKIFASEDNKLKNIFPKNARFLRYYENHDEALNYGNERPDRVWEDGAYESLLFALFTLDGIPMIYNGVEIADNALHSIYSNRDHGKMCTDWSNMATERGKKRFAFMKELIKLRKELPALVNTWATYLDSSMPDDIFSFVRTHGNQVLVSITNTRNTAKKFTVDIAKFKDRSLYTAHIERGAKFAKNGDKLEVELQPFGFVLVELQ